MRRINRHRRVIATGVALALLAAVSAAVYSVATRRRVAMQAAAEAARDALRAESEHPAHASDAPKLVAVLAALEEKQAEIDRLYARWSDLQRLASNVPA